MNVSVLLSTWNRAGLLDRMLAGLHGVVVPPDVRWELLLINNACTDHTEEVARRHQDALPMKYLVEERAGKSYALNTAIEHAAGDCLLFTDDDVLVDSQWIAAYCGAFQRWPDAAYFGGRIDPWYEETPPPWMRANENILRGLLVVRDVTEECRITEDEGPFGANMAVRRSVLTSVSFNTNLGPRGNERTICEEADLLARIESRGGYGVWVPSASVQHLVPRERMSREFLWSYCYGLGRSLLHQENLSFAPTARSIVTWQAAKAVKSVFYRLRRAVGGVHWVHSYANMARYAGMIAEARNIRRSKTDAHDLGTHAPEAPPRADETASERDRQNG